MYFTIAANNYLAHAAVLARSLFEYHADVQFVVCVADRPHPGVDYSAFPGEVVFASDLGIPGFESLAFQSSVLELCTAVKPFMLRHLRDRLGVRRAIYLDPDILVLDSLSELEARLDDSPLVLIPHLTRPADNEVDPSERKIRLSGVYNLGFLGIRLDAATACFLDWWAERLRSFCFSDPLHGLFVDQSWVDFAPCFCDGVFVERDPRYDLAYWNLDSRPISRSGGRWILPEGPVRFFHFSGFDPEQPWRLTRFNSRIQEERSDTIAPFLADYRARLIEEGWLERRNLAYGFEHFLPSGCRVPSVVRRLLARVDSHGIRWRDPFRTDIDDSFCRWLTEPLELGLGTLNRLALGIWESSMANIERFPNPCLDGLPRFVAWLEGLAATGEIDRRLLEAVRVRESWVPCAEPYLQFPHRPLSGLLRPRSVETLARLGLDIDDAAAREWLADPVHDDPTGPPLSRLALLLYEADERIARAFPTLRGEQRDSYALWLCREGGLELGLDSRLVQLLFEKLSPRLRHGLANAPWRAPILSEGLPDRVARFELEERRAPLEEWAAQTGPRVPQSWNSARGVTLLGGFRSEELDSLLVKSSEQLIQMAGLETVRVDLDLDPWGRVLDGRWLLPAGSPFDVILAHVPAERAPWLLGWMAGAATMGVHRIGYLCWPGAVWPEEYSDRFGHFHEIWVPSSAVARALSRACSVPLEIHPPYLTFREMPDPGSDELCDPQVQYWVFVAVETVEPSEIARLVGCLRAVADINRQLGVGAGVFLASCPSREWPFVKAEFEHCLALLVESAPSGLPLRIVWPDDVDTALAITRRRGVALLPRVHGALSLIAARSMAWGVPVCGDRAGVLSDLLDYETGFVVESDEGRQAIPTENRAKGLSESVERTVRIALERALLDPERARTLAEAASDRLRSIHGLEACRNRLLRSMERITARLGVSRRNP